MSASRLAISALLIALIASATALTCYENDDEGNIYERTNSSWKYCSLIPFASTTTGGRLHGVAATNENLGGYDATFGQNTNLYKVLVMCIYEKYDFSQLNKKFAQHPEFMFRCFCNTDRCNSATTFAAFLTSTRAENQ